MEGGLKENGGQVRDQERDKRKEGEGEKEREGRRTLMVFRLVRVE
jgi:hypothetical protein